MTAATLIADLTCLAGRGCPACGAALCGHELLVSIAAGFKREPRCSACLASALGRDRESFRRHVVTYIHHRDCYSGAWEWATAREGPCRAADGGGSAPPEPPAPASVGAEAIVADARWDAGDMACGDLVLELRRRLQAMPPGAVLHIVARDPGAPEDLPAWCGMTGHRLVFARHPEYAVERRRD